jgi:hypothetical protein|tara:strand:+ start:16 stop:522 length:507 start_codon:yes stop_codon:yes gene_type:complete
MPKVNKSQLIEVINTGVASTGNQSTKIQFPDQPYLRGKQIYGIEIFTFDDFPTSPSNRAVIPYAVSQKSFLTLYSDDIENSGNVGEWIQLVPFTILHRTQTISTTAGTTGTGGGFTTPSVATTTPNTFARSMFLLQGQKIIWEKSYISLSSAVGNTVDVSFLVQVYFK